MNDGNDKIKVQNGRETSRPNGAIDYGGETLEHSFLNVSKSPIRKPSTAASCDRRKNLTELMKLLQNGKNGLNQAAADYVDSTLKKEVRKRE